MWHLAKPIGKNVVALAALSLSALLILWPLVSGYAFVHDEYHYCTLSVTGRTLAENVRFIWQERQYRLLDLFAGYMCNPSTLDARWTMALQGPALAAITWGIHRASKRFGVESQAVAAVALLWFNLHAATSVSLWIPTVGQTWGAAAGVWLALHAWDALECLSSSVPIKRSTWIWIVSIGLVAPHVKETYYGWVGAITAAILICGLFSGGTLPSRSRLGTWLGLLIAVLLPPLIQVALRMATGGLALAANGDAGRHHVTLGLNVIYNVVLSIAGAFAAAPIHYARRADELRFLAYLGIVLSSVVGLVGLAFPNSNSGTSISRVRLALIAATSWLAVSITWPMGRISELYLMGPNVGMALMVSVGAMKLWKMDDYRLRILGRCLVVCTLLVASIGFVSRAVHFRTTWSDGRDLYAQAFSIQSKLHPSDGIHVIGLPAELAVGWQHSQYVMPPANALSPPLAEELLNTLYPNRKVHIVVLDDPKMPYDSLIKRTSKEPELSW